MLCKVTTFFVYFTSKLIITFKMKLDKFKINGSMRIKIKDFDTKIKDIYEDNDDYEAQLVGLRAELDSGHGCGWQRQSHQKCFFGNKSSGSFYNCF